MPWQANRKHGKGMKAAFLAAATAEGAVAGHCCCKEPSFEKHELGMSIGVAGPDVSVVAAANVATTAVVVSSQDEHTW